MTWYVALCVTGLVALGWGHAGYAPYPQVMCAAMLPVAITLLSRSAADWSVPTRSAARMALVVALLAVPLAPGLASEAKAATRPRCELTRAAAMFDGLPPQVVLTDADDGPELLYRTAMLTVGSRYPRNPTALARLHAAWQDPSSDAVPVGFRSAGISLVLFCPQPDRPFRAAAQGDSLRDRLHRNDPPGWLVRLRYDGTSGYVLYQVRR